MSEAVHDAALASLDETRAWLAEQAHRLPMFVVTDHPTDWPDFYVARLHFTLPQPTPAALTVLTGDLDELRKTMAALGLIKLDRSPEDDPVILETWI